MKRRLLAIIAALALTGPAKSDFVNGEDLHNMCQKNPNLAATYVLGVLDTFGGARQAGQLAQDAGHPVGAFEKLAEAVCLPSNTTGENVQAAVCEFLADQPKEYRKYAGHAIVWEAITRAYATDCN
jgi:hypothetical protein